MSVDGGSPRPSEFTNFSGRGSRSSTSWSGAAGLAQREVERGRLEGPVAVEPGRLPARRRRPLIERGEVVGEAPERPLARQGQRGRGVAQGVGVVGYGDDVLAEPLLAAQRSDRSCRTMPPASARSPSRRSAREERRALPAVATAIRSRPSRHAQRDLVRLVHSSSRRPRRRAPGISVIPRRAVGSAGGRAGAAATAAAASSASTTRSSISANAAPRQRRTPPPNGIHVYVPPWGSGPRNRSGRNARRIGVELGAPVDEVDRRRDDGAGRAGRRRRSSPAAGGCAARRAAPGAAAAPPWRRPRRTPRPRRAVPRQPPGDARQALHRPAQRGGGRLVAGDQQRDELVAQLLVGHRAPSSWRAASSSESTSSPGRARRSSICSCSSASTGRSQRLKTPLRSTRSGPARRHREHRGAAEHAGEHRAQPVAQRVAAARTRRRRRR